MRDKAVVGFDTVFTSSTITRPANTTTYTAGDVMSNGADDGHFTFTQDGGIFDPGHLTGTINFASFDSSANKLAVVLPDIELWLFHTDIADVADNGAFAPTDAEMATRIAIIPFPAASFVVGNAGADAAGNVCCELNNLDLLARLASFKTIYGQAVVRNGYVPVSAEVFTVWLGTTKD